MTDLNLLLKHTSRSLYLSAHCLPQAVRPAFSIAYLLCRYADSIADTALLPPQKRLYWITRFPDIIMQSNAKEQQQLAAEISGTSPNIYEEELLKNLPACLTEFQKLSLPEREIIMDVVRAVCHGMAIDLQTFPPENAHQVVPFHKRGELENYCHLMGGEPGVFWSRLIASHVTISAEKNLFLSWGKDIGDALQMVNILRDLPRDLRIGRCYFPEEELQTHGLTAPELLEQINSPRFEPIKQAWIAWARQKLRSAKAYFSALPKTQLRHRAAVAWPVLWAADTLNKLEKENNLLDPGHKVKISHNRIYFTLACTPFLWLSNSLFNTWLEYKLQRKTH